MATADELLTTVTDTVDEILTVDLNTRIISIPATIKILGVEADDDVKRLRFRIPRYYGEFDLSEFIIHINFENARGGGDVYPVDDVAVSDTDDTITFSWLVDRYAFLYKGDVEFNICMKKYDDNEVVKELNTTPATLPVLKGLETTDSAVDDSAPGVLDTVLMRLYAIEAASGLGEDGYYTILQVSENDDGVVFTIINQDGELIKAVKHGKDGYTPVKGTDYFTDDEQNTFKSEISDDVKDYVDSWAPKSLSVVLSASFWADNRQAVSTSGVTPDNIVIVSPDPAADNYRGYIEHEVRCVSQVEGSLIFQCSSVPETDLVVNVAVYYTNEQTADTGSLTATDDGEGNVTIM